jgi:N-methylhydantoinase A
VEAVTYRVQVVVPSEKVHYRLLERRSQGAVPVAATRTLRHLYGDAVQARCYERSDLLAQDELQGPCIVWELNSTTFVPMHRTLVVGDHGELVIT